MSEGQTQRIRRLREALFLVTDDPVLDIIEAVLAGASEEQIRIASAVFCITDEHKLWELSYATGAVFQTDNPCPTCGGSGKVLSIVMATRTSRPRRIPKTCPTCHGTGKGRGM